MIGCYLSKQTTLQYTKNKYFTILVNVIINILVQVPIYFSLFPYQPNTD